MLAISAVYVTEAFKILKLSKGSIVKSNWSSL